MIMKRLASEKLAPRGRYMFLRMVLCGLLLALSRPVLRAQGAPTASVGWYNGDCHSTGIGGWANWYLANDQFTRELTLARGAGPIRSPR